MRGARVLGALAALALGLSAAAQDTPTVPRPAGAWSVLLPAGGQLDLSQYRGKVVVVQVLMTTCPHCAHASQMLSKLQGEYGARGLQVIGVSFDPMPRLVVPDYVQANAVKFPVGFQTRESVYAFLGVDPAFGVHVPQLVFIDRKGVVRHQSQPRGDADTAREENVRKWVESLVSEQPARARRR